MPLKEILNVKLKQIKKLLFMKRKTLLTKIFTALPKIYMSLETLDAPFLMILHSFDFIKYRRQH